MRKLKLQVQVSIDGFIAGPGGEMDWMSFNWDDHLKNYVKDLTDPVDCIVLGRKLAQGFIPYWASVADDPNHPEHLAGKKFTSTHKVVFTRTIGDSAWDNTVLEKGDLAKEIGGLKQLPGSDIIAYGGAGFVSSLIKTDLIDEYHLFINPTAIGKGMTIFHQLGAKKAFNLIKATSFDCGIVVLHYEPKK